MKRARWPGDWKYDCQRCGWTFPSHEIRKEWTGLYVCANCWEPKHPQLLIKIREETARPKFINKDPIDQFVQVCDLPAQSCYSGLARSGCAKAGNQAFSFAVLEDLFDHGHGD